VILNGDGRPAGTTLGTGTESTGDPGNVHIEKYDESDFFLLDLPLVL
jgi:hypothetical protein